jgi:cytidylate kinase
MRYRVLTVSREYGSGGARIAQAVADQLGWKLLDGALIDAIARAAHVDPDLVSKYDEHVESWLKRLNRQSIRSAALAGGVIGGKGDFFDAQTTNELTRQIIEQAYAGGNCVIVGRGAQFTLQSRPDVFHVFIYAPFAERVRRLRARLKPGTDVENKAQETDTERAKYLHQRFSEDWKNPHLYDLMVSSHEDEQVTARLIVCAMSQE